MRVASALAADHRIERVGLIGRQPPSAWGDRTVAITSALGWDVAVGVTETGVPQVSVGAGGDVEWAGPTGLARALGFRLGTDAVLAGTVEGEPIASEPRFGFPPPLGWLGGAAIDGIHHCPTRGTVAAVMAVADGNRALVVLDDRLFLDAALLAAGVLLAADGHQGPVWTAAERYLDLIGDLGLVLADRML